VNAGICWLKHHVASLGGDPHSVGGIGASSGGHLLLLNGLRPQAPEYRGDPRQKPDLDARLRFMVACWPIVDPLARYQMAVSRGLKSLVMAHEQYWVPPGAMETGNPQGILNTGAYSNLPELMIVQGTEDANMTPEMIHRFVASYREAGGTVKLHSYDGQPHDFFVAAPGSRHVKAAMAEIRDFILANNS
jgi:acetyl esterase